MNVGRCNACGKTMFTTLPIETCLACSQISPPIHTADDALAALIPSSEQERREPTYKKDKERAFAYLESVLPLLAKDEYYREQPTRSMTYNAYLAGARSRDGEIAELKKSVERWKELEAKAADRGFAIEKELRVQLSTLTSQRDETRKECDQWEGKATRLKSERDAAREENARLRDALKFYAGGELSDIDMDIFDKIRLNTKDPKRAYVEFVDTEWLCGPARAALAAASAREEGEKGE